MPNFIIPGPIMRAYRVHYRRPASNFEGRTTVWVEGRLSKKKAAELIAKKFGDQADLLQILSYEKVK